MNQKLSLEIGADIKGMEAALKKADQLLKQHTNNYKNYQSAISQNTQKTQQLESSISRLSNEYKKGNISQAQYSRETDRLTTELAQVNNETADYQKELKRLDHEMDRVAQSTANYASTAGRTQAATNKMTGSVNRLGNVTKGNATPALMGFSQIVQDAPYGIRGVANNITQLTEQFSYLSKSSGGAKGALKAMASSLMGPAGIMIGVSLVTSLLVTFGDKLFASGEAAKTAEEKLQDYTDSLEGVAKAHLKAGTSAQRELVQLRLLERQATNAALATDERRAAVEELRRLYPGYLKGMSDEQIMANGLTTAYNEVAESIMRKARAQAASDLMVDNLKKEYTLSTQLASKKVELEKAQTKYNEAVSKTKYASTNSKEYQDAVRAQEALEKAQKEVNNLQGQIQGLELSNINLEQDIKANGDLLIDPKNTIIEGGSTDPVEVPYVFPDPQMAADEAQELIDFVQADMDDRGLKMPPLQNALDDANYLSGLNAANEEFFRGSEESWDSYTEKVKENLEQQKMSAALLAQAFSSMSNQLIDGLVEGKLSMEDFVKSTVKMIGKMLVSIAAQAIANAVLSGTQTAAAAGPGAAFLLPGLIAGSVGAVKGALPAFADGGIVGGSSLYGDKILARVNSKELILNTDQQKELYKQLQNPKVVSVGNNEPVEIYGETFISGDMIRVAYHRAEKKRGRVS